jgi:hypothetical protein
MEETFRSFGHTEFPKQEETETLELVTLMRNISDSEEAIADNVRD